MNFAEIENTWRSPHNRPTPAQLEELKMKFVAALRKRHRAIVTFLSLVGAALVATTGWIVFHLLSPRPGLDPIDLGREWAVLPFFALPWIGWILLVRQYRRHRAQHPDYGQSIAASVRALLDENRLERVRFKLIAGLQVATLVVLPLIVYQLRAVGKAGDEILLPAFVVFPVILLGIFLGSRYRYRRQLLPRQRELEALLSSYE